MLAQPRTMVPLVVARSTLVLLIASVRHPKEIVHRKVPKEVQSADQAREDKSKA